MVTATHVKAKPGDVLLLVGTTKGAFVLRSDRNRKSWEVGGPYFPGHSIYALAFDGRAGRRRLWAGAQSGHFGAVLAWSDDFGKSWTTPETANVRFPEGAGVSLKQIWQILPGRDAEPDTLYCGVEPAALFVSRDAGDTWDLERGLFDHPHRTKWEAGGGGLCLHTVVPDALDPKRLFVAVSTGGLYRTDDGGRTWAPRNNGIRVTFLPEPHPEFGQ